MLYLLQKEIDNISLRKSNTQKILDKLISKRQYKYEQGIYRGENEWMISRYSGQVDELQWVINRLTQLRDECVK